MARSEIERTITTPEHLELALKWAQEMVLRGLKAGPVRFVIGRPIRSKVQNSKMWPMLRDISEQVSWVVNGSRMMLEPEDWKVILSSGLDHEQRIAMGLNGGVVMLGLSTSRMEKGEFCQLIELIYAFGADYQVKWSEKSLEVFRKYPELQVAA